MKISKLLLGGGVVSLVAVLALVAIGSTAASTTYEFIARGIVMTGGSDLNIYFTHTSPLAESDLAGNRKDISVSTAKIYQWTRDAKGKLYKKPVKSSSLKPGQEVVVKGSKRSNETFAANWVVINDKSFTINGKLTARKLDTGSKDTGSITVQVVNSTYKSAALVGKDVEMRIDGATQISALGKTKQLDEVTAANQSVRVKGLVVDNSQFAVSTLNEL